MHIAYPPLSMECVKDITRIVISKKVKEEKVLLAKCCWSTVGAALGLSIGEPPEVFAGDVASDEATLEAARECRSALESVTIEDCQGEFTGAQSEAIDPVTAALLYQVITLAIKAISDWLAKRQA